MKDRIRFISHRGKKILLVDASNMSAEELVQLLPLALSRITAQARGSVLLLADFSGSRVDKKGVEAIKPALVIDSPLLLAPSQGGTENLPKVSDEYLKSFSAELPLFKTREEAMDWLVED
jgi:hypothetical protein